MKQPLKVKDKLKQGLYSNPLILFNPLIFLIFLPLLAEDESEPEEENRNGENAKEPRDSGCFESSENLENGREEPKTEEEVQDKVSEEQTSQEEEKQEQETEQQEENQTEQLDAVQEQLQELTVDEGS